MSNLLYTVDNLVSEVRSLIDEANVDSVSTELDILPSLNRGLDYAFDVYARKYPEPILAYTTLDLNNQQIEYDIPESVFEDRIVKLEVIIPSGFGMSYREMLRISYRDLTIQESPSTSNVPYYYAIIGRKIRVIPSPSGTYNIRLWYLQNPEKLVLPQGRITHINNAGNYVILDSEGSSLTTESDSLGSYVNLIDGQTGTIKATLQIQNLAGTKVTFRAIPLRNTVLNRTISGALPADLSEDDYLCAIDGICVPYYGRPTCNFLVQFSVAEMIGKLGGNRVPEEQILDKFEKQIERTWVGRERQMRVQKRSSSWGSNLRRWWYR